MASKKRDEELAAMAAANAMLEGAAKEAGYKGYGRMAEVKTTSSKLKDVTSKIKSSTGGIQLKYIIILIVALPLFFWLFYNTTAGKMFSAIVNPVLDVFKGNVSLPFLGTFGPLFKWFLCKDYSSLIEV